MLRFVLPFSFTSLALISASLAGPMPILPDLPPLPTTYAAQPDGGPYAGFLTGYAGKSDAGLGIAVFAGNKFQTSDLVLALEGVAFASATGEVTVEADLRAGLDVSDSVAVFGLVGLGYSFDTDAFTAIGASLEADVSKEWSLRADYRYNHDLNGDDGTHKVLAGLSLGF